MGSKQKILIADDEPDFLDSIKDYFFQRGYEVETAPNGHSCALLAMNFSPDVMVLDMRMPKMTGYEVIEYLQARHFKIPKFIVVSGHLEKSDIKALDSKGIKWFEKPVEYCTLLKHVEELLSKK